MTYRALLIGNSTFEADSSLNPLNAPTKDVARLHRALVDTETGLFDDNHVRLVTERTTDELLDELDTFFTAAHRDDLLLLYYSGHGLLDERNQLFLCGRNTRSDRLLRTAVSNVRINEFIEQSVARCTVIVLDCCGSGMFKGGDIGLQLAGPGRYVVSSTRGSALANDAATTTGTSLFTEYLVTGLLGEAEDHNGDGFVDLREIYDYVRAQLTSTTKQVPHCRFDGDAAVTLARRPALPPDPPPMSKVSRAGMRAEAPFALSENVITLHNVDPDERLGSEVVEIYPLGDAEIDCAVETDATWIRAEVRGERVVINLHPQEGSNRGKIMVRDRHSGTAQALRVEAYVNRRSGSTSPPAGVPTKGGATAPDAGTATKQEIQAQTRSPAAPQPPTSELASLQPPNSQRAATEPAGPRPPDAHPSTPQTFGPQPAAPRQSAAQQRDPTQQPPWPAQQGRAQVPPALQRPTLHGQEERNTWPAEQHEAGHGPQPPPESAQQPSWPQERYSPPGQAGQPGWPPPQQVQSRSPQHATNSKAKTALITAVVAFVLSWLIVGGLIAPFALVLASQANKQKPDVGQPSNRGLITAARILAWGAIAICALGILGLIIG
jgi:hypothetical protein